MLVEDFTYFFMLDIHKVDIVQLFSSAPTGLNIITDEEVGEMEVCKMSLNIAFTQVIPESVA